jgi:hypothetical protein
MRERSKMAQSKEQVSMAPQSESPNGQITFQSRLWPYGLALFVISLLQYALSLTNEFVFDSKATFLEDPSIRSLDFLPSYFTSSTAFAVIESANESPLDYYWPLVKSFHLAEYLMWGENPLFYNATNIILNGIVVVLLFFLIVSICKEKRVAFVAALLYAVNPVRVEVVSWAYSDSYIIVAIFILASFLSYINQRTLLAYGFFVCALFSKETAILLPAVILLYHFLILGHRGLKEYYPTLPFFVLAFGYLFVRYLAVGSPPVTDLGLLKIVNAIALILPLSLKILVFPDAPTTLYILDHELLETFPVQIVFGYFFIAGLIALGYWLWRNNRIILFWYLWFFVWLSIAFNAGQYGDYLTNEKVLYLPAAGMATLAAHLLLYLCKSRRLAYAVVGLLIVAHFSITTYRTRFWTDDITYFKSVVEHAHDYYAIHYSLAIAYIQKQDYANAEIHLLRAVELNPRYPFTHSSLGNIYYLNGQIDLATHHWRKTTVLDPTIAEPYFNLGLLDERAGQLERALGYYRKYLDYASEVPASIRARISRLSRSLQRM